MLNTVASSSKHAHYLVRTTGKCVQHECHYCDNRRKVQYQSKRGVKLKSDPLSSMAAPPLPEPLASATQSSSLVFTQTSTKTPDAAILSHRLDRRDALQTAPPTDMGRYNQSSIASVDRQLCHHDGHNKNNNWPRACFSTIVNHNIANKCPSMVQFRTLCWLSCWHIFIILNLVCLYISVISANRYIPQESNLPSYSQYYPPYLQESFNHPSVTSRTGKSRTLAKSQEVISTRRFLEPSFSGGEINGIAVLRKTQLNNDQLVDYFITSDIVVPVNSRLEIEPGVRILFAARVGITVYGALLANVSALLPLSNLSRSEWK